MNATSAPSQAYQPIKTMNPAEDPYKEAVKQCCGYTIAVLNLIGFIGLTLEQIQLLFRTRFAIFKIFSVIRAFGYFLPIIFFFNILRCPSYLAGKPPQKNFWPLYLSIVLKLAALGLAFTDRTKFLVTDISVKTVSESVALLVLVLIYGINDESKSCFLCFKPWIYKAKMIPYNPAYPPQAYQAQMAGGYPPQAYQAPVPSAQNQNVAQV